LRERFTDEEASATARGRGLAGVTMGHADDRVVWWCTIEEFCRGSGGFNPCFGETEEVRVVTISQVRGCGSVERMKNGADIESADSEFCYVSFLSQVTRQSQDMVICGILPIFDTWRPIREV